MMRSRIVKPHLLRTERTPDSGSSWSDYTDLVECWPFTSDETGAHDSKTLTEVNGPLTYGADGVDLEPGSSQRLTSGADSDFSITSGNAWSATFRLKPESIALSRVLTLGSSLYLRVGGSGIVQTVWGSSVHGSTETMTTGTSYFWALGFDGSDYWYSLDGGSKVTATKASGPTISSPTVAVGGESWGQWYDGTIKDLSFWKRELTDAEIDDYYAGNGPY